MHSAYKQIIQQSLSSLIVACAVFVGLGILNNRKSPPVLIAPTSTKVPADARLSLILDRVEFHNVKLVDALRSITDRAGLNVAVNSDASDARLDEDSLVDFRIEHVDVVTALNEALAANFSDQRFVWTLDDGVIKTFTQSKLDAMALATPDGKPVVGIYDVHDIAVKLEVLPPITTPAIGYQSKLTPAASQPWMAQSNAVDEVAKCITDNIETVTWKYNGGDIGSITRCGSTLIVVHTPQVQRRVQRMLHLLNGEP